MKKSIKGNSMQGIEDQKSLNYSDLNYDQSLIIARINKSESKKDYPIYAFILFDLICIALLFLFFFFG